MTTPEPLDRIFIRFSIAKLEQLAGRIADCLGRLSHGHVWSRGGANENAVGNLVLHLCGNVRQWIGTGVGELPDVRARDAEFAAREAPVDELRSRLESAVREAVAILGGVSAERLGERIVVQNHEVTVLEAIAHVVEHFSHHTGQILYATKQLTGADLGYYRHLSEPRTHRMP